MEIQANELMEIMSSQIKSLSKGILSRDSIKTSESIANMAGKMMKMAELEIKYAEKTKSKIPSLPLMMRD